MKEERRKFFGQVGAALGIPLLPTDVLLVSNEDGKSGTVECRRGEVRLWFLDISKVNVDDLLSPDRQDKIIRCVGDPRECVMVYGIPKNKL